MGRQKVTTIQMDFETSRKLGVIAKKNNRSKAQQMSWMVDQEFEKLVVEKLTSPEMTYAEPIEVA